LRRNGPACGGPLILALAEEVPLADYRVYRGDQLLGTLTRTGGEMFWDEGDFDPAPGFETVRSLFNRERELLEADRIDEWCAAWDELAEGLRLEPVDGRGAITEFLLHIEGDGRRATWRY
jgi:hypothetical protein